jgi:hypothetical protein
MTAAAALAFPGGRTLAAWWRQLAEQRPEGLWAGYLTLHRVETPVRSLRPQRLGPLEFLVFKAVAARMATAALGVDAGLVGGILRHLAGEGLVTPGASEVTAAGREALAHGQYLRPRHERLTLYFWHADWLAAPSSQFVHLAHPERITWLAAPPAPFAVEQLHACVGRPAEWKRRHAFPAEIGEVLVQAAGTTAGWDQVAIATPERLFGVVIKTPSEAGPVLTAWAVNPRNWELHAAQPVFTVPHEPPGWFPPATPESAWRAAFVEWCLQRQIAAADAEHCGLKAEGSHLRVEAPAEWKERLRGETWLLAGDGLLRTAVRLELE